ncbi:MaoC family dehydratase [Janibacter melonis]|uniref:MaoC family dehydratase n=1 Tax=Janibacter melonis TaxID=262209 RepID=A0A5P8FIB2_9MICO|nr:MaoC family dehydratase [Janibacter melonis]QFQ29207.1 MaoC family dehydratase [Janibacter melonis]
MSTPRTIATIEDLRALVGHELGSTEWVEITQERVDLFADATGDHQWIHVDVERAEAGPFGGTIAHGFLTLSLLPSFGAELFALELGSARLNYGLEGVRFTNPVRVGSRIRGTATFEEVNDLPKGTQVVTRYVVEIEGVERPACVARQITLVTG